MEGWETAPPRPFASSHLSELTGELPVLASSGKGPFSLSSFSHNLTSPASWPNKSAISVINALFLRDALVRPRTNTAWSGEFYSLGDKQQA